MDENNKEYWFWQDNKDIVYSLSPYNYLLLLLKGEEKFKWSAGRVSFLKKWWWQKFGKQWQNKLISDQQKLI